jgi:mRNA-degrading endonuclease YafQ of YafQ-DinJ toxin-antitoxin module
VKRYFFSKKFKKQYDKLPTTKQEVVDTALILYLETPNAPRLCRHFLKGEYTGQISISAGGDLRIHLVEDDTIIIVVVCVGSHSQLYK